MKNNQILSCQLSMPYFFDDLNTENGTRKNPFLLHFTSGQKDDSRVFHFKENRKYFQYHISNINKKSINLKCIYFRSQKCKATLTVLPKDPNLIKFGRI